MDMTVENALPDDLPAITAILNHAILHTTAVWYDDPRTDLEMRAWFELKRELRVPVLVARSAGQVAGYASYGPFRPWSGYRHTMEHSVYVAEGLRGRGAGRLLLGALVERARQDGLHALIGGVEADNAASLALHRSLGFEEVGRLPEVGTKFGRWLTLVFMQRVIHD
ncbi:MAG: GNAT family N-acetyltransferase [Alphaproteobacteria bacterium]|nr:GNAT family N-acetyltransferase [Alphaproteobacteria bacterium]